MNKNVYKVSLSKIRSKAEYQVAKSYTKPKIPFESLFQKGFSFKMQVLETVINA